jgi:hypothetical protein
MLQIRIWLRKANALAGRGSRVRVKRLALTLVETSRACFLIDLLLLHLHLRQQDASAISFSFSAKAPIC